MALLNKCTKMKKGQDIVTDVAYIVEELGHLA